MGAALRRGEAPWWMPGIYTGFPALAQVEIGSLYPSNLLLFGLLDPHVAIAYAQLLPLLIAGLGAWALAGEYGLPIASRLLAAGSFSLCGFLISHFRQLNMVDAAAWIPLLVLMTERIARGRPGRALQALALFWALELLAGHPQISYFSALVLAAYFIARSAPLGLGRRWLGGPALGFVSALALGTLLASAQLLPGFELARASRRQGGLELASATAFSAPPQSLALFLVPDHFGDPGDVSYKLDGIPWEQYGYLGLAPALLAAVAVVASWRRPVVIVLAAMGAVSALLALGANTPLFPAAFRFVPGMAYFRFPTRFLVFTELAVALLGAFGLAALLAAIRSRKLQAVFAAVVIVATAGDLWIHQTWHVPQARWEEWRSPIWTAEYLRSRTGEEPWRYHTLDSAAVHFAAYRAARGWRDPRPFVWFRELLQPSSNLLAGLEAPDGYANLVPRWYEAVWGSEKHPGLARPSGSLQGDRWVVRPELVTALRAFNIRFVLTVRTLGSEGLVPVARSPGGVAVYEVENPLPRAFVVGRLRRVASGEEALRIMSSPEFDPEHEALVEDVSLELPAGSRASRSVRLVERTTTRVRLRASLPDPGLLVLSEGYYPGWRVRVDGADAPLFRVNLMMRGTALGRGEHDVLFEFRSPWIRAGFALSALGVALVAIAWRRLRNPAAG